MTIFGIPRKNNKTAPPKKARTIGTADAFSNPAARLGFGQNALLQATEYPLTRLTQNYALMNSLYRGNWLVQNIIDIIPTDMVKKWFRLGGGIAAQAADRFFAAARKARLRESILTGLKWGRLYGGAVGLILIEGQTEDLSTPLELDAVMPDSFRGLYVLDRWNGVRPSPNVVTDIASPDFGLPEYYDISDPIGAVICRAHCSRVVRFAGRQLPMTETVAESHWGASEIESVYAEIVKRDNVSENIASLVFKACIDVETVESLDQLFAIGGQEAQRQFWETMKAQSMLKSNFGTKVMQRGDTFDQKQYAFAGLGEVYQNIMMDVAGASHIPVTKLFGRSSDGMNATGEGDLTNYYDYVENQRESGLRPALERLAPVIAMSAWGESPDELEIEFEPLRTPTPAERADIAAKSADAIVKVFQASGMDQAAMMTELKALADATGLFGAIGGEAITAGKGVYFTDLQAMADPFMGLSAAPAPMDAEPGLVEDADKWVTGKNGAHFKVNENGEVQAGLGIERMKGLHEAAGKLGLTATSGGVDKEMIRVYTEAVVGAKIKGDGEVTGVSDHAIEKFVIRGGSPEAVVDTLANFEGTPSHDNRKVHGNKDLRVVMSEDGTIVTVIKK
jgi:phage-related protein (TIGR01555 family)